MVLADTITKVTNVGVGVFVVLFILSVFIEWTPLEINPIGWIGDRFNRKTIKKVGDIETKLDLHIADDYRSKILMFQNECIARTRHTKEEFKKIISICDTYEKHIQDNHLSNGEVTEAIGYIKRVYRKCLDDGDFVDLNSAPL